jgi:hypothetical protein
MMEVYLHFSIYFNGIVFKAQGQLSLQSYFYEAPFRANLVGQTDGETFDYMSEYVYLYYVPLNKNL